MIEHNLSDITVLSLENLRLHLPSLNSLLIWLLHHQYLQFSNLGNFWIFQLPLLLHWAWWSRKAGKLIGFTLLQKCICLISPFCIDLEIPENISQLSSFAFELIPSLTRKQNITFIRFSHIVTYPCPQTKWKQDFKWSKIREHIVKRGEEDFKWSKMRENIVKGWKRFQVVKNRREYCGEKGEEKEDVEVDHLSFLIGGSHHRLPCTHPLKRLFLNNLNISWWLLGT